MRSARAVLLLGATILLGACSTASPATTPIATPPMATLIAVAPSATAVITRPTVAATPPAAISTSSPLVDTPAPVDTAAPTHAGATLLPVQTSHGALDLEELIPGQVGDITLDDPLSLSGQEFFDAVTGGIPQNVEAFNGFLARLGRSVDDLSGATASGFSESSDDYVYVTVNRVAGADSNLLLSETVQFTLDSIPNFNSAMVGTATQLTLAAKPVTKIVTMYNESMVYDTSYYYAYGDTLFKVSASAEEVVAEALSLLP